MKSITKAIIKIQVNILSNFGNTAYQRLSKDFHFDNVPAELYEIWQSSFLALIDINRIKYLSYNELSEYYSQLTTLKNKLEIIFHDISMKHSNIP